MVRLSNGHSFEYVVASGALGFDGKGWWWERPLVWSGLMNLNLFAIGLRTLTRQPRLYPKSNLSWIRPWTWLPFSPWSCVRFLPNNGAVNKVGLYNPGIEWWCKRVGPHLNYKRFAFVASIFGTEDELVEMVKMLNKFEFAALEVNVSCPNTGHAMEITELVVNSVREVKRASRHPVIVKVSVDQDHLTISRRVTGIAEAISLNSVRWELVFPDKKRRSPLWRLEKRVGGGGGGVSGKPAQEKNWAAVKALCDQGSLPVIAPSVMEYEDVARVKKLGAQAVSFGAIHLKTPWKPTKIVKRRLAEQEARKR